MLSPGMRVCSRAENRMELMIDTEILSASDAIAFLASQTDLRDVSVSGVTTEALVAGLYKEYGI